MNYNMYAGAFLGTVFVLMTVGIAGNAIFSTEPPEEEGFAIAVADDAPAEPAEEDEGLQPITPLLASADIGNGPSVFRKCQSCHNIEADAANKTGPNLWNVVGMQAASKEGFSYSAAMSEYGSEGNVWDFEALNRFLAAPGDYIDGTSMGFAGLRREGERADLIAWMAEQGDEPVPLPSEDTAADDAAADDEAPADEAPADGEAPADEAPADGEAPAEEATADEEAPAEEATADEEPATEEATAEDAAAEETAPTDGAAAAEQAPAQDGEEAPAQ
ncbi:MULTISPECIES: cytochrome c family protein [unclassified Roseitalea]|uniref:c-type cytochrome n=1 Tax=unclassified Roseitalea TaxID=2639107 RepID=UPI00273DBBD4|nr:MULTISPECIES: cytochrome c family protein [unclassified Roseitalea]